VVSGVLLGYSECLLCCCVVAMVFWVVSGAFLWCSECLMCYLVVSMLFWVVAGVLLNCSECLVCYFGCYGVLGGCWGVARVFRVLDAFLCGLYGVLGCS